MKNLWQRFITLTGADPEIACISLLIAGLTLVFSVALLVWCVVSARYLAAAGVAAGLISIVAVCVRDYRRGRWSRFSALLVAVWLLASLAALAYVYSQPSTRG
jgi:hypothetical protein